MSIEKTVSEKGLNVLDTLDSDDLELGVAEKPKKKTTATAKTKSRKIADENEDQLDKRELLRVL